MSIFRLTKLFLLILSLGVGCDSNMESLSLSTTSYSATDSDLDSDLDLDSDSDSGSDSDSNLGSNSKAESKKNKKTHDCSTLENKVNACKASPQCWFNEVTKTCQKASSDIANSCPTIQLKNACNNSTLDCAWDSTKTPPQCTSNQPDQTIYVWEKLPNPGNKQAVFNKVVMSGDGKLYALNTAVGAQGLWYKNKNKPWVQLINLTAKPRANATTIPALGISGPDISNNLIKLHATQEGAVIQTNQQLVVLHGDKPVWALDTQIHNKQASGNDAMPDVEKSDVNFSAVVETAGKQALLFQQYPNKSLVFHYIDHKSTDLKTMQPKKEDGTELDIEVHAAANDSDGGLLIAGGGKREGFINRKWQVFQIPKAHNNFAQGSSGTANTSDPVLFSNDYLLSKTWLNDAKPMTLLGKIGDYYFSNLISDTETALLSHKGPQEPARVYPPSVGTDPHPTFIGKKVTALIKFANSLYVATEAHGLLGATNALEEAPAKNFNFQTFRDSKTEMMDDKSELDPNLNNNAALSTILQSSDEEQTYFVVRGHGIYVRSKDVGQPRL